MGDCEDELICDFAQYYHVLDIYGLRPTLAATLAAGLPTDSRTSRKRAGTRASLSEVLLAHVADNTAMTAWLLSDAARRGEGRPTSVLAVVSDQPSQKNVVSFSTPDEFRTARNSILQNRGR